MTFKEYIFELQKKKTRNFKHVCGQERKMSKDVQPVAGKNEIVVYQPEVGAVQQHTKQHHPPYQEYFPRTRIGRQFSM